MIIKKLLKKVNEKSTMSVENTELLLSCAIQKEFSKGDCLLKEGEICDYLYFVENGFLRTYIYQEEKEININFTFEGNFTGNIKSLKTRVPSENIIEAGEKSLITLFEKDALLEMFSRSAQIEIFCRRILGTLLIESSEHINFYKRYTPQERYEYLIKNNPQIVQKISISQLSSYLGVARETLSRIRKKNI